LQQDHQLVLAEGLFEQPDAPGELLGQPPSAQPPAGDDHRQPGGGLRQPAQKGVDVGQLELDDQTRRAADAVTLDELAAERNATAASPALVNAVVSASRTASPTNTVARSVGGAMARPGA
jgi:hypothetical protein